MSCVVLFLLGEHTMFCTAVGVTAMEVQVDTIPG